MVYSEKFYVGFSDVGQNLRLRNSALLKLFENICCLHGTSAGDGFRDTPGRWFLTAYHVRVFERPQYEDWVYARTWSREMKGVSASREFEIIDHNGKLCAAAISNWARINSLTGKLEKMSAEAFEKYQSEPFRTNFGEAWIQKLKGSDDSIYKKEFYIDRNMIDPNRHMNNVCYIDLAERALPEDIYELGETNEFEITYRKAIAYAETVSCLYSETDSFCTVTVKGVEGDVRSVIKLYK